MATLYFIDESGNSGDIATEQALHNFSDQPFFSLACIGTNDKKIIDNFASGLIKKHKIQANELKSVNICSKRRYIIPEIIDFLIKNSCNILVEVINKKYQLCSILVNYYIMCPYLSSYGDTQEEINKFIEINRKICDFIYKNIEDSHIKDFIDIWNTPDNDISKIQKCFNNVETLCKKNDEMSCLLKFIDDSMDVFNFIRNTNGDIEAKKRFMPPPDYSGTKKYGILPNVNCLTNIYARINKIENVTKNITILHDEQKEFNLPLEDIKKMMEDISSEKSLITDYADFNIKKPANLSFVPSKDEYGVQLADIIAGVFMRHVYAVSFDLGIYPEFSEAYQKVITHQDTTKVGVNLVIPELDRCKLGLIGCI